MSPLTFDSPEQITEKLADLIATLHTVLKEVDGVNKENLILLAACIIQAQGTFDNTKNNIESLQLKLKETGESLN